MGAKEGPKPFGMKRQYESGRKKDTAGRTNFSFSVMQLHDKQGDSTFLVNGDLLRKQVGTRKAIAFSRDWSTMHHLFLYGIIGHEAILGAHTPWWACHLTRHAHCYWQGGPRMPSSSVITTVDGKKYIRRWGIAGYVQCSAVSTG